MKKNIVFFICIFSAFPKIISMDQSSVTSKAFSYDRHAQEQNELRKRRNVELTEAASLSLYPCYDSDNDSFVSIIAYICCAQCVQQTQTNYRYISGLIKDCCPTINFLYLSKKAGQESMSDKI